MQVTESHNALMHLAERRLLVRIECRECRVLRVCSMGAGKRNCWASQGIQSGRNSHYRSGQARGPGRSAGDRAYRSSPALHLREAACKRCGGC
eukprot:scaffold31152_cov19-Tisochrysis_lutea.AAC.1